MKMWNNTYIETNTNKSKKRRRKFLSLWHMLNEIGVSSFQLKAFHRLGTLGFSFWLLAKFIIAGDFKLNADAALPTYQTIFLFYGICHFYKCDLVLLNEVLFQILKMDLKWYPKTWFFWIRLRGKNIILVLIFLCKS